MDTITARLQTPADEHGVRKNIHLITDSDAVMVKKGSITESLTDVLDEVGNTITISTDKPTSACIWYEIKS